MAVVLGGTSDPEVDFFVQLHIMCSTYNKLPAAGGVYDQDSYLMYGLFGAAKAFAEREQMQGRQHNQQLQQMQAAMAGMRTR
jgi:hypothetical protein